MLAIGQVQGSRLLMVHGPPPTSGLEQCVWAQALALACLCSNHGAVSGVTATEDSIGGSSHPLPCVSSWTVEPGCSLEMAVPISCLSAVKSFEVVVLHFPQVLLIVFN